MNQTLLPLSLRRTRTWATNTADVSKLSRSARRVADSFVSRMAVPAVAGGLNRLSALLATEHRCRLEIGDVLLALIDGHGLRPIDIARQTGRRSADLSQMLKTARAFPPEDRPADAAYNHLLLATRMATKFQVLRITPSQALDRIVAAGITQHRDATRMFAALDREATAGSIGLQPIDGTADGFNRPYLSRYQDLIGLFPDGSIDLLHLDPPYAGQSESSQLRSAYSTDCDNAGPEAAIGVVLDLLRDWQPKLAMNGVALLWQPWGSLLPPIASAIAEFGWGVWGPIVWDKGRPQPGAFSSPYAIQGEMLWMLHRRDGVPKNRDDSSRESILRFHPVSFPSTAGRQLHAFEKPNALMKHLLLKHSLPGDLIFDACGCVGVMSRVAMDHGRRWVYAESNASNYHLGVIQILRSTATAQAAAS